MLVRCHHGGSYRRHGLSSSNIPDPKAGIELGGKKIDCRAYFGREEPTGWIYAAKWPNAGEWVGLGLVSLRLLLSLGFLRGQMILTR